MARNATAGRASERGTATTVVLPFVLIAVIWGSTWLVIKDQIGLVSPSWTVVARFAIGVIGMVALAVLRGESLRLPAPALRLALVVGLAQFCLNFEFVCRAEQSLTSGIVSILYALLMVPNAVLARIFHRSPLERRFLAGSAVAICGIALLLLHEYRVAPPQTSVVTGLLFGMSGLLSASIANVLQIGKVARETPTVPFIAWAMIFGVLIDTGVALAIDGPPPPELPLRFWGGALYLGLVGSVVTFPLYFDLIRRIGAGKAAYNGVAVPVIAMLLSTIFESYRWTVLTVAGAGLAMLGLLIALSSRRS